MRWIFSTIIAIITNDNLLSFTTLFNLIYGRVCDGGSGGFFDEYMG